MRRYVVLLVLASSLTYAQQNNASAPKPKPARLTPTATPKFSPKPGKSSAGRYVVIQDSTPGAIIYYTTDGSAPTSASSKYSGPVSIFSTTALRAIAVAPEHAMSSEVSAKYEVKHALPFGAFS